PLLPACALKCPRRVKRETINSRFFVLRGLCQNSSALCRPKQRVGGFPSLERPRKRVGPRTTIPPPDRAVSQRSRSSRPSRGSRRKRRKKKEKIGIRFADSPVVCCQPGPDPGRGVRWGREKQTKTKTTAPRIPMWSPTMVLTGRH